MKSIQLKTVQKEYEYISSSGVMTKQTKTFNVPVTNLPQGVRILIDGATNECKITETKQEEASLINDYPALKDITDKQKPVVVANEESIDP